MKLIKLTDDRGQTKKAMDWPVGKTNSIDPDLRKPKLCTDGVLHAYTSIPLALLMAPAHGCAHYTRVFEIEADVEVSDPTKCGTYEATVLRELPLPNWYTDKNKRIKAQVAFAIACAEAVLPIFEARFPDDNRPRKAIEAAKNGDADTAYATVKAARAIARAAAANAAAHAAVNAAISNAADAVVYAAAVAAGNSAAVAAAHAAAVATWAKDAAWTPVYAAEVAVAATRVAANPNIDLDKLAVDAVNSL